VVDAAADGVERVAEQRRCGCSPSIAANLSAASLATTRALLEHVVGVLEPLHAGRRSARSRACWAPSARARSAARRSRPPAAAGARSWYSRDVGPLVEPCRPTRAKVDLDRVLERVEALLLLRVVLRAATAARPRSCLPRLLGSFISSRLAALEQLVSHRAQLAKRRLERHQRSCAPRCAPWRPPPTASRSPRVAASALGQRLVGSVALARLAAASLRAPRRRSTHASVLELRRDAHQRGVVGRHALVELLRHAGEVARLLELELRAQLRALRLEASNLVGALLQRGDARTLVRAHIVDLEPLRQRREQHVLGARNLGVDRGERRRCACRSRAACRRACVATALDGGAAERGDLGGGASSAPRACWRGRHAQT
jgi:hypothetical protein